MSPQNANVERLARDAAALVRVASPADWPSGFVVLADRLPSGVVGLAFGTGEGLATVYGVRIASQAVLVDPWKLVGNIDTPTTFEVAEFEAVALHEAAHTLTLGAVDPQSVAARLDQLNGQRATYPAQTLASVHTPRWAMAFWLLASRGTNYRRNTGRHMLEAVARDVALYGYQRADLERLAAEVAADEPLAERLADGGAFAALLADRLPDESTRTNAIVARGVPRGGKEG